ncbi:tetratricopeptide (TPR) repeat protein [Evansella vedderi]|uniref:Tetratricopeptide (TPR) repeat protein n=1 Tax=Evansella vedderi TaxID=38282 RepID=A0ABT9ZZJ9_9BACI|nr:tetratricopeptide repeat protein [Evansella vedderi]MDQ0256667.1 tetratricopeptide (TPR) repeat protein [Evansella vedderi]
MDEKKRNTKTETEMENEREEKIISQMEEAMDKKQPKVFKKWQAALLLGVTLFLSIGGGITFGNMFVDSDLDMRRVKEQLAFYEERMQLDPNNLGHRVAYAYTNYLLGNYSEAIKELNWVINQDPKYFDAHLNIGIIYLEQGRLNEAMFAFRECTKLAPLDYKGFMNLGRVYIELEMYAEALEVLNEANQLSRANTNIIYHIGLVGERTGDYEFAETVYREALQYDPMNNQALDGLTRVAELRNQAEEGAAE